MENEIETRFFHKAYFLLNLTNIGMSMAGLSTAGYVCPKIYWCTSFSSSTENDIHLFNMYTMLIILLPFIYLYIF